MVTLKRFYEREDGEWVETIPTASQSAVCDSEGQQITSTYQTKAESVQDREQLEQDISDKQDALLVGAEGTDGSAPSEQAGQVWLKVVGDDAVAKDLVDRITEQGGGLFYLNGKWVFAQIPTLGTATVGGPRKPVYILNGVVTECDEYPEVTVAPDTPVEPEPDTPVEPEPDTPVEPEPDTPSAPSSRYMVLEITWEESVPSFGYAGDLARLDSVIGKLRRDGGKTYPRQFHIGLHEELTDTGGLAAGSNKAAYKLQYLARPCVDDGGKPVVLPLSPANMGTYSVDRGGWEDGSLPLKGLYVCLVDRDGSTKHRLDPNDYSKGVDEDGLTYNVPLDDFRTYQVMLAIPKMYVKRDSTGISIVDSPGEGDTGYTCLAHTLKYVDADGNASTKEFDELLIGMYPSTEVTIDGEKYIGSYSSYHVENNGHTYTDYPEFPAYDLTGSGTGTYVDMSDYNGYVGLLPVTSGDKVHTRKKFREEYVRMYDTVKVGGFNCANEAGDVWMQTNWFQYSLFRDLCLMALKGFDSQHILGYGYDQITGNMASTKSMCFNGVCNKVGWFFGDPYDNISSQPQHDYGVPVKCFLENPWGNVWTYLDDMAVDPSYGLLDGEYISDGEGTKGQHMAYSDLKAGDIPFHDAIGVYAGYNHPDLIGRSHDDKGVVGLENEIGSKPLDDEGIGAWSKYVPEGGMQRWGKRNAGSTSTDTWQSYPDLIEAGHANRVHLGDVDLSWANTVVGTVNPYIYTNNGHPSDIVRSGPGWGLPSNNMGGGRSASPANGGEVMNTSAGLGADYYVRPCHRGCAMFGGRAGHGNGSGIMNLSIAPDLDNDSFHHGSRIVLLRNRGGTDE